MTTKFPNHIEIICRGVMDIPMPRLVELYTKLYAATTREARVDARSAFNEVAEGLNERECAALALLLLWVIGGANDDDDVPAEMKLVSKDMIKFLGITAEQEVSVVDDATDLMFVFTKNPDAGSLGELVDERLADFNVRHVFTAGAVFYSYLLGIRLNGQDLQVLDSDTSDE